MTENPLPVGRQRLRAIVISDLHIGTPGFQADALLEFLKCHDCETLYLVGDIVDGWQLRRRWFWPQSHNDVMQKLLRRARKGSRVIYVPGNHDEFARGFAGHVFGGVDILREAVHTTATGQRLWVIHGDHVDGGLAADQGQMLGGVLDEDLQLAVQKALAVPRQAARERALAFGWDAAAQGFVSHLVSVHARQG